MATLPHELLIISWPIMNRAAKVLAALEQLNAAHLVHLKYGGVLVRDSRGTLISTIKHAPVTAGEGAAIGAIVGGIAGIVVQYLTHRDAAPRDLLQTADDLTTTAGAALGAAGGIAAVNAFAYLIPHPVLEEVERALAPRSSALIAVVHFAAVAPALVSLRPYPNGTIIQATLPRELIAQLAAIEAPPRALCRHRITPTFAGVPGGLRLQANSGQLAPGRCAFAEADQCPQCSNHLNALREKQLAD